VIIHNRSLHCKATSAWLIRKRYNGKGCERVGQGREVPRGGTPVQSREEHVEIGVRLPLPRVFKHLWRHVSFVGAIAEAAAAPATGGYEVYCTRSVAGTRSDDPEKASEKHGTASC
jgi:hypothetical protein